MSHGVQSGEIEQNCTGRCVFSVINISEQCILLEIILMKLVPHKRKRQIGLFYTGRNVGVLLTYAFKK